MTDDPLAGLDDLVLRRHREDPQLAGAVLLWAHPHVLAAVRHRRMSTIDNPDDYCDPAGYLRRRTGLAVAPSGDLDDGTWRVIDGHGTVLLSGTVNPAAAP